MSGLVCFALALTSSASAQDRPRLVIDAGAGWVGFPDDGLVGEGLVCGAARWHLLSRVSVGPEAVYIAGEGHSHLVLTGNLTMDLRRGDRVVPFVVVGGGVFQTRETVVAGDFTSSEGAFTAGGGLRTSVTDRVTIGIDVRVGWETHVRINGVVGVRLGR